MKAFRQLGFLKLPFRKDEPPEEDGRVLALFRNRAELKKAYGELQDEIYRLKDRVKQQEGATQRVQEMLAALETRLGLPESAYPALVFYQLRRLWQTGRELVELFVADLSRQQEERERRQHVAEYNRRQFTLRQSLDHQVAEARSHRDQARRDLQEVERQLAQLNRLWHYFKRRALAPRLLEVTSADAHADAMLVEACAAVATLDAVSTPEFPGLSLDARRAINLMAIAFSEVLCLRLAKTRLVTLAREATGRRETTDEYGSARDCERLMTAIERAYALLETGANNPHEIKVRADRLKQIAVYRNPPDTTPLPESIAPSEGDVMNGEPVGAALPNVLAEDTWDLYRILLR